MKYQIEETS